MPETTTDLLTQVRARIAVVREIRNKATPGKWEAVHKFSCHSHVLSDTSQVMQTACCAAQEEIHRSDAELCAARVNSTEADLDLVEGLLAIAEQENYITKGPARNEVIYLLTRWLEDQSDTEQGNAT